jgi:hypothetical protein
MRRDDRVNVIILDACRDNPFAAVLSRSVVRAAVSSRGLQPIGGDLARGALIAFATEPGNTAFDGPAGAHSPFTAALLRHIEEPATSIETVMRKVRGEVFAATDSKQLPWVNTSIVGDFELNPAKPVAVAAPQTREAATTQATENLLWESAERSRAGEDYKTYLEAFPNGVFAPLARRRVEVATPSAVEAAETALQLSPTDRALTRKALNVKGGGDAFDDGVRAALRDWQTRHGYPASGYLDGAEMARLKDEATPHAAPALQVAQPPAKPAPVLVRSAPVNRAPVKRAAPKAAAPVVAAAPSKPTHYRPRRESRPAGVDYARDDEPAPAPAPAPGDGYIPSYGPVVSPSFGTGFHFGGFHHHGWSDRRLKRDICRVGTSPSGIPVYTFRYRWSEVWYAGAMAQDLLTLKPQAVRKLGAYYQVDYDQIDVQFEKLNRPAPCADVLRT